MPFYVYQAAYTPESLAAQIKEPQDRMEVVGRQLEPSGARIVFGGFTFGEYDLLAIIEAPDDTTMAAVAVAIAAGGGLRAGKTSRLLSGAEWVEALQKAGGVGYRPVR
jgi:uncharacterized protein with GYD domain